MYISKYINNNSIAANWMIPYPFIMKNNGKVTGNALISGNLVWPGFFITVTEVKTHSASRSCVALLAPSKFFSADAELIKEETVLQTSKLVLVKENGALNPPEVDYRECYCMWVRGRNPFKTDIVNTSFTSLFDLLCFNRHFGEKIYWIKDLLLLFSLFFHVKYWNIPFLSSHFLSSCLLTTVAQ